MSFGSKKGEFDRFFNLLDRPVEESRPDRQPDRPVDPTSASRPNRFLSLLPLPTAAGGSAPNPPSVIGLINITLLIMPPQFTTFFQNILTFGSSPLFLAKPRLLPSQTSGSDIPF